MVRNVALAVAALVAVPAFAESTVNIYGAMDVSVGSFQTPGSKADKAVESGKMTTSFIGFGGKEELSNDLSAVFALESYLGVDKGNSGLYVGDSKFWGRAAYVGLDSKTFGSVKIGRTGTPLFDNTLEFNPFLGSFGFSPAIRQVFTPYADSTTELGDTAWDNSVLYTSPTISGVQGKLQYASGEGTFGRNVGGSLSYHLGGFGVGAVYQDVKSNNSAATDETKTWQLGAAYDFRFLKVYGLFTHVDNKVQDITYKLSEVGVSVPTNPGGKVLASYGLNDPEGGSNNFKTFTVGYDYNLSKSTDVYVNYMYQHDDTVTQYKTGNTYAVGLRKWF